MKKSDKKYAGYDFYIYSVLEKNDIPKVHYEPFGIYKSNEDCTFTVFFDEDLYNFNKYTKVGDYYQAGTSEDIVDNIIILNEEYYNDDSIINKIIDDISYQQDEKYYDNYYSDWNEDYYYDDEEV